MEIHYSGMETERVPGYVLPESISRSIFNREDEITGIEVKYFR
jgi:hypothetical protein